MLADDLAKLMGWDKKHSRDGTIYYRDGRDGRMYPDNYLNNSKFLLGWLYSRDWAVMATYTKCHVFVRIFGFNDVKELISAVLTTQPIKLMTSKEFKSETFELALAHCVHDVFLNKNVFNF